MTFLLDIGYFSVRLGLLLLTGRLLVRDDHGDIYLILMNDWANDASELLNAGQVKTVL